MIVRKLKIILLKRRMTKRRLHQPIEESDLVESEKIDIKSNKA